MERVELFAPIIKSNGEVIVELDQQHPGHDDRDYRLHRNYIAGMAVRCGTDAEPPLIRYTPDDDQVWRTVTAKLARSHEEFACREVVAGKLSLNLPTDRVPQLREISRRLGELTGFQMRAVAGLAPIEVFYSSLASSVFHATQFIRHRSSPFFSPDPDMLHEVLGHGSMLATDVFADMYRMVGEAARGLEGKPLEALSKVFWFTLEGGVIWEGSELKAYGASLLSSSGELEAFRRAEIRDLNVDEMLSQGYEVTRYQPVLFAARSVADLRMFLGSFLATL